MIPVGIDLAPLPPASLELQPVDRLWLLFDDALANRTFPALDDLEAALVARRQTLRTERRQVKRHTRSHWWPRERRRHMRKLWIGSRILFLRNP